MASSRTFPLSFPAVNGGDGSAFRQLQQISEFIGVKKPRAMTSPSQPRRTRSLQGCSLPAGAHFQHGCPDQGNGSEQDRNGNCNVPVCVRHIDLVSADQPKNHHPQDSEEQSCSHSTRREQQSAEHNPHSGSEDDGNPRTMGRCSVRHTHNNSTAMMRFLSGRRRSRTTQSRRWHVERDRYL